MKKSFIPFILLLTGICSLLNAQQISKGWNWQAIPRNGNDLNAPLFIKKGANSKFTILKGSATGTPVYAETHTDSTNAFGLLNFPVGKGTPTQTWQFDTINWRADRYFLKVELDLDGVSGGLLDFGTSEILFPPQAEEIWLKSGENIYYPNGNVGIGTSTPIAPLYIKRSDPDIILEFNENPTANNAELRFVKNGASQAVLLWNRNSNNVEIQYDMTDSDNGNFIVAEGTHQRFIVHNGGGTEIKSEAVGLPFANGNILNLISTNGQGALTFGKLNTNGDSFIQASKNNGPSDLYLNPESPGSKVIVPILQITGGDGAEAHHISSTFHVEPGMVVVFDEIEEGKIRTTTKPYDKKAAGVVSGKGKYFAGLCLLEAELGKGAIPLALFGTVEVFAIGPIQVGDLLTTSQVPGYVMAATDTLQTIGATVGKAKTSLKAGEHGVVEMLVEKH